jgi:hypothetical protein
MTAQRRRSATLDRRHDLELAEAHMAGMGRTPSRSAVAEDVRHPRPLAVTTAARQPGIFNREVERACHLAERADGDAGVERRRVEFLMSQ